jgi:ABC-type multidrug transport system fused ATPase/permease subunit
LKKIIQHTWAILEKQEKNRFLRIVVADIIISILDIIALALLVWIVQFYIQPDAVPGKEYLPGWMDHTNLWLIAIFLLLFSVKNLFAFLVARSHFRFIGDVAVRISEKNLSAYQQAPFTEFINTDSSIPTRKISYQPFEFGQHILTGIQQLVIQGSLILFSIVAILLFNAKIFLLLLLILLPPVILVFFLVKKKLAEVRSHIRSSNEGSFRYLFDALKGYVESNIYGKNDFFLKRFVRVRRQFSNALFDSLAIQNMPGRIIEVFAILGLFLLIAIATWGNGTDSSMLLTIGAFIAAAYRIIPGLVKIINVSGQMKAYEFTVNELSERENPGPKTTVSNGFLQSVELENISFAYPGKPVIDQVNLALSPGDMVGLTGISGKGKTTLIHLLLGFLSPGQGIIRFNGKTYSPGEIQQWWPRIAYVRQQGFFIHDSLLKNITLDEGTPDQQKLETALEVSGLKELLREWPEGLAKEIMENGKNISGGQQQRISIARAIYRDADLIILDEPFNELDETAEEQILIKLRQQDRKMILLITHRTASLGYCTKRYSLDE